MRLELLVEEQSAEEALKHILPKIVGNRNPTVKIINFGSKYRLLKFLPERLAAYRVRIQAGERLLLVVLVDRDTDDCETLKLGLEATARNAGLLTKASPGPDEKFSVLNRIAIEELESWFIGDPGALRSAFSSLPRIAPNGGIFRNPDNGGTWEALHRFLKKHGIYKSSYPKIDAARRIAPHMNIEENRSTSFRHFVAGLRAMLQ